MSKARTLHSVYAGLLDVDHAEGIEQVTWWDRRGDVSGLGIAFGGGTCSKPFGEQIQDLQPLKVPIADRHVERGRAEDIDPCLQNTETRVNARKEVLFTGHCDEHDRAVVKRSRYPRGR